MARYAMLYEDSQSELRKTKAALMRAEHERESYRLFINECGHVRSYMLWLATRLGFDAATVKTLEGLPYPGGVNEQYGQEP